ncbi:hypothetical protein GCM10023213_16680 [Prosthecobacter algae]|uniref:HEAT repeat protein n=1 Tax=Prosthecobacter algae TaxID=1144682 RepID=A0ABP9P3M8_9BACT
MLLVVISGLPAESHATLLPVPKPRLLSPMPSWNPPTSVNLVDLGFMDARSKLIDLAAFLDRVQRAGQEDDFRVVALKNAIAQLSLNSPTRAQEILLSFSDPSSEPIEKATMQGAIGAFKAQG